FMTDGSNWLINSSEPFVELPQLTTGTNVNNILEAVTCGAPAGGSLALVGGTVTTSSSRYSFQVQYTPGATDLDTTKTVVQLNGATVTSSVPYDASTHLF